MKRLGLLSCLVIVGTAAFVTYNKQASSISLFDGTAIQTPNNPNMYMVGLRIENDGPADRLLSASSPSAQHVSIMNPEFDGSALVVPAQSTAMLAMDGAHAMLMANPEAFPQGSFLPLNLEFANAGPVSVKVRNIGATSMNHGLDNGISEVPSPTLELSWITEPNSGGADLKLETTNFTFLRIEDTSQHSANQGHAHIYLNGLKLGRVYSDTYQMGALSPGAYTLTVSLNSNDHRPYLFEGSAVRENMIFEVEE